MIKAVLVDVDGVLVNGRPADGLHWGIGLEADLGLPFGALQSSLFQRHWEEIIVGRAGLRDCLTAVLAEIAPALTSERILDYWFRNDSRLDLRLLDDLGAVRTAGIVVYLATNQEHLRAHYIMEILGLGKHVDGCFYSAALGVRKPWPGFFETVLRRIGMRADQLLLIDDAEDNIRAAAEAGWCAALWTGRERLPEIVTRACPREQV